MSSWEVTLSILKYPLHKRTTEDLEGDSDNEQWDEEEWNLLYEWGWIGQLETILGYRCD